MLNNFLNGNLPPATVQRIKAVLAQCGTDMPFMISLTPTERQTIPSVSDGRLPYVLKLVDVARQHRVKIGMSVEDFDDLQRQAQLFEDLTEILYLIEDLRNGVRDTRMQVGAILYRLCRAGHAQMEIAYSKGKPGLEAMLDNLNKLFANQGGTGSSDDKANGENAKGPDDAEASVIPA